MKSTIIKFNTILVVLGLLLAVSSFAQSGAGGSDEAISQFVTLANSLLDDYSIWTFQQKSLLGGALRNAKIVSVPVLLDQAGNPVRDQEQLVAYGSPGLIQLKVATVNPDDASWVKSVKENKPIAHYIAHELYRASGAVDRDGKSPDETFQITIGELHLDHLPNFKLATQAEEFLHYTCTVRTWDYQRAVEDDCGTVRLTINDDPTKSTVLKKCGVRIEASQGAGPMGKIMSIYYGTISHSIWGGYKDMAVFTLYRDSAPHDFMLSLFPKSIGNMHKEVEIDCAMGDTHWPSARRPNQKN